MSEAFVKTFERDYDYNRCACDQLNCAHDDRVRGRGDSIRRAAIGQPAV